MRQLQISRFPHRIVGPKPGLETPVVVAVGLLIAWWSPLVPPIANLAHAETNSSTGPDTPQTPSEISVESSNPDSKGLVDPQALDEGKAMFRGLCSGCHGGAGRGGKGPNLTDDRWLHGNTNADIARVIQKGVSGTTMKKLGESLKKEQIAQIIAYIRSLAQAPGESDWKPYFVGDPKVGEQFFFDVKNKAACNKCHAVNRRGGGIGPALDRIASRRSPQYIMESMVQPSKDIDPRYEQVMVITDDGKTIKGLRVNESNFNIQLREENGQFHSLHKRDLEEVQQLDVSLMPGNLVENLNVKQLHDLFAFLMTLE
jgi:putative heme-binding domain-containing protein